MFDSSRNDGVLQQQAPVLSSMPWHVVYTQPRSEEQATLNLDNQGFETYFPKYKAFKKKGNASLLVSEAMFPRYVFFRPAHAGHSISGARSTRGVSFILTGGAGAPSVVKPEVLTLIRECEQERDQATVEVISPFQPGRKVRLRTGALQGLDGLVQKVSSKRVMVLLELLGRPQSISVEHSDLELS